MPMHVTFVGNAGNVPETHHFNNGGSVTSIPVAVSQGYFDKSNNWVDLGTMWINVESSSDYTAEQIQAAARGSKLLVTGTLQQRWYTARDGREATALRCRATAVGILHKNTSGAPMQSSQPDAGQQPRSRADDPWAAPQDNSDEFGEPDFSKRTGP